MNMPAVSESRDSQFDLIGTVNEAALGSRSVAEFEANVLPTVKLCFDLSVSSLSNRHTSIGEMPDRVVFCGIQPDVQDKYQKYYRRLKNPVRQRVARPEAEKYKGILDSQDVFEDASLRAEKLYREFHGPHQMDRSLAIKLTEQGENTAMLGLWRSRESRRFDEADLQKVRCIAQVLAHAYGRLTNQAKDGRLDWLTKILAPAEFQDAIVLLDAAGRIAFANPAGQAALADLFIDLRSVHIPTCLMEKCRRAGMGEGMSVVLDTCEFKQAVRAVRIPEKCGSGYLLHMSPSQPKTLADDEFSGYRLSTREIDVTRFAAKGLSTKQIANEMCLSTFTIQDHLKSIYRKLRVNNRAGLIRIILGYNCGLLKPL